MSSPLSMLKKTRRAPLQDPLNEPRGRQTAPFRRNLTKESQTGLVDGDESFGPNPALTSGTPTKHAATSTSKGPKKAAAPSDFELMTATMQRVNLLEKTVRSQTQELKRKDKKISDLEEKLRPLKEPESDLSSGADLERRCHQLQDQVYEMETFLNDLGLIWVGGADSADGETSGHVQRVPRQTGRFHVNFNLVLQRIRELNVLAGEGECIVRSTATGAQLAKRDPVQLSLYSNGIVMFDGPFRSYQEPSTQRCMQDLMDGYFPSELQERFPDGVPFELHDRRDEEFSSGLLCDGFPGEGRAVRGETDRKLSVDHFLHRLPKLVVKAGRVLDIRDSLRNALQGSHDAESSNAPTLIDTPALRAVKERLQMSIAERPASARDVISLKVKSEDGNHTFMLKMRFSETIGHLRRYLDEHRGPSVFAYDIISAYPQRCYDDDSLALRSCGFTANAALLLRKRKHPPSLTEEEP